MAVSIDEAAAPATVAAVRDDQRDDQRDDRRDDQRADQHAERSSEIAALIDGAVLLLRAGNRVSAIAALWSAVGVDPCHLAAHRRLAAALANGGDVGGAVAEYERFFEALTAAGQPERAAAERRYGHTLFGDAIPLALQTPPPAPLAIADAAPLVVAPHRRHHLDPDQARALRRVGIAAVALVATFAAMLIAGAQIFARPF